MELLELTRKLSEIKDKITELQRQDTALRIDYVNEHRQFQNGDIVMAQEWGKPVLGVVIKAWFGDEAQPIRYRMMKLTKSGKAHGNAKVWNNDVPKKATQEEIDAFVKK